MFILNQNRTKCVEIHSLSLERITEKQDVNEYLQKTEEVVEKYGGAGLLLGNKLETALQTLDEWLESKAYYYLFVNNERFGILKSKSQFYEIVKCMSLSQINVYEVK